MFCDFCAFFEAQGKFTKIISLWSSNCCQNMPNHCFFSLLLGFDVSVGILPRKVVFCCDFILCAITPFWDMSFVGIYPGRASLKCDHSNESHWTVHSCGTVYYAVQGGPNLWVCEQNPKFNCDHSNKCHWTEHSCCTVQFLLYCSIQGGSKCCVCETISWSM